MAQLDYAQATELGAALLHLLSSPLLGVGVQLNACLVNDDDVMLADNAGE